MHRQVSTLASAQEEGEFGLAIGAKPPAVTIEDLDGHAVNLGQVIGKKPVLLEFWATWCEPCLAEMPALERAAAALGDAFAVVAVKVFTSDLDSLDSFYRIVAFIVLGILLLLGSFLYLRFRETFSIEPAPVGPALFLFSRLV